MINITQENIYLDGFTKLLKICLHKELKKAIEQKQVLKPKGGIEVDNLDSKDIECLKYLKQNIGNIVNANIDKQKEFIKIIKKDYPEISKEYNKNDEKPKIYQAVKYIFVDRGYEAKISTTAKDSIAYKLVESLDLKTCHYCNRNYISYLRKDVNGKKQTRPQLDHFYPKAIYPFLACSFYNLIPCCTTCNHIKSDDDSYEKNIKSPYEIDIEDFIFSYSLTNLDILNNKFQDYNKNINIVFDKKIEENEKCFQLEKLYKEHRDIVIELLVKKQYYPHDYINELSGFGFSKDEIYRYLFCNYKEDENLHKRPLSKLIKDISEELGLI
ncbi:MAG: hypothetical protein U9N59_10760 [Campylobacterota bacterium]|nr:hypothetical protein [Campylobacterota bacterium]